MSRTGENRKDEDDLFLTGIGSCTLIHTVCYIGRRSMMALARVSGIWHWPGREPDDVTAQAFLAHRLHQPSGLTGPATSLQVFDSAMKFRQLPHFCSPFG